MKSQTDVKMNVGGLSTDNKKPHTESIGFNEILADFTTAPRQVLSRHNLLSELTILDTFDIQNGSDNVLYLTDSITKVDGKGNEIQLNTVDTIGLILQNNAGENVNLACYSLDNQAKRPLVVNNELGAFILGDMSLDSEWWCVDSIEEGIKLYKALSDTEHVTVISCVHQSKFIQVVKHFSLRNNITINATIDKKDDLTKKLMGTHATLVITPITTIAHAVLECGESLEAIINAKDTERLDMQAMEWGEPESLASEQSKPTPYPMQAWSGILQEVIEKIAYYAQVPHAMAGQCVLGALAHMGQRFINAPLGNSHMPTSLIVITESESGSGKSSAMKLSHYEINNYERNQYEIFKTLLDEWQKEKASLLGKELKEFLATNPTPINNQSLFKDSTIEPILDKYLNSEIINASLTTDEAGQFFNGYTMKGDTAGNAMSAITQLYDSGNINRVRSQKGSSPNLCTQAHDVRFTMFIMGQRIILKPALTDPTMNGQGLLARGVFSCPQSLQGYRVWNDPKRRQESPYNDHVLIDYWNRCKQLLDPVPSNDPDLGLVIDGKPNRVNMQWQDKATEQAFYNCMQAIEKQQGIGGCYEHLKAYGSRMAENASRIASLLAYFDKREVITKADVTSAFQLVEYSMNERLRYLDICNEQSDTEKLSDWLIKKAKGKNPPVLNRTTVYQGCPKPMLKNNRLLQIELDNLESMGHIKQEIEGRKKVIYINPRLFNPL